MATFLNIIVAMHLVRPSARWTTFLIRGCRAHARAAKSGDTSTSPTLVRYLGTSLYKTHGIKYLALNLVVINKREVLVGIVIMK